MRTPRIRAEEGKCAVYHCISRIVGGSFLLKDREKEAFVQQMWKVADFHGIDILTYVVMGNHYHQLLRVPAKVELSDEDLLSKLMNYYGQEHPRTVLFAHEIATQGKQLKELRDAYLKRMGDLSIFEKIFKQRFSIWYNHHHDRKGTLWMERFKSVLIEDEPHLIESIAAYIELNPIRASMVEDPKNYRFCSYGAALGGDRRAQQAIQRVYESDSWEDAASRYRLLLVQRGHTHSPGKRGIIRKEILEKALKKQGKLSRFELLHLRVRYFTDGLVIGSEEYVEEVFSRYRSCFGKRRKSGSKKIPLPTFRNLNSIRALRTQPLS